MKVKGSKMATQMTEKEAVMQGIAEASQTLDRVRNKILERINNLIKNPSARFTHPDISETDKLMEGIVKAYDILEKANERLTQRIYLYQGTPISEIPPPMMQSQLHYAPEEEDTPISEIPPPMMQYQLHSAPEEESGFLSIIKKAAPHVMGLVRTFLFDKPENVQQPYMYYPGNASPKSQPYMYYPGNASPKSQGTPISEIPPPMMQPQLHSAPEEEEEPEMTQGAEGELSCQADWYYPGNASQKSQPYMYYPGNATPKSQMVQSQLHSALEEAERQYQANSAPNMMMQSQLHSALEEAERQYQANSAPNMEEPEMTQGAEGELSCQACMYYPGNASQKSQIEMKVEEIEARVEMLENLRRQAAGQSWAVTTRQWG